MTDESASETVARETRLAARNAVKLGLSLAGTLTVAIGVRFWIPRALGPDVYGQLHFAESLAMMFFLFSTLGVDVYTRKEHSVRVQDASRYFGGFLLLRWGVCIVATGGMAITLLLMNKEPAVWRAAFLLAGWQLFKLTGDSVSQLLQTAGTVTRLSIARPILKLVWGGLITLCILFAPRIEYIAAAFVIVEMLSVAVYFVLIKRELNFEMVWNVRAAWPIVVASVGYFINFLVHRVYERLDVQMLTVMVGDEEVGYYGAAANLALAGLIFLPVVNSVILPMAGRIASKDKDSMNAVMRVAVRIVLVASVLPSLLMALFPLEITRLAFGDKYDATAPGLAVLGVLFPLTYVAVVSSMQLIQLGRIWTVTRVSVLGLVVNPALNFFLIPIGYERLGAGGGGVAAAFATVATEFVVVVAMWVALGRDGFDRTLAFTLVKLAGLIGVISVAHSLLPSFGLWRMPAVVIAFGAGVVLFEMLPKSLFRAAWAAIRTRAGRKG